MTGSRIRAATPDDAAAIARVHVQAWKESYPGIVPDAMLEALSVERNTGMWATILGSGDKVLVHVVEAETSEGTDIIGFGAAGDTRDQALETSGEVTAIYLIDRVKRRGIGRELFVSLLRALAECGHASAGLWVLVNNAPTRRFYEALGGRPGPTRTRERSHGDLHEIAYRWDDLARFGGASKAVRS